MTAVTHVIQQQEADAPRSLLSVGVSVSDLHPNLTVGKTAGPLTGVCGVIPHPLLDTGNPDCLLTVGVSVSDLRPVLTVGKILSLN